MLVTLEGLDGSGKTTVWDALHDEVAAEFTREPTRSWYGEAVARSVADPDADPLAELFLYTADHAAHLADTVRPALDRGAAVISDRYADSRYAYQGATLAGRLDDPIAYIQSIHEPFTPSPDLTVYLAVDPETAVARSDAANKFERIDYLEQVRDNYEQLIAAEPERFVRVDASQPEATVVEEVTDIVVDRLSR